MKLSPVVWGPVFWATIHITALAYPQKPTYADKKAAKEFFESLPFLLPCSVCKEHLKVHLRKQPITTFLDRRDDLFKYTVMLHNEVNISLNKPVFTELEALQYLQRLGLRNSTPMITNDMLNEIDMRSMIKGGFIGGALIFTTGLCIYYFSKSD
jgi:hypothetical protein